MMKQCKNEKKEFEIWKMEYVNVITWLPFKSHICAAFCSNFIRRDRTQVFFCCHSHYSHRRSFTSYWHGYGGIVSPDEAKWIQSKAKRKRQMFALKWGSGEIDSNVKTNRCDIDCMTLSHIRCRLMLNWALYQTYRGKWNNLNMTTSMNILWSGNSTSQALQSECE